MNDEKILQMIAKYALSEVPKKDFGDVLERIERSKDENVSPELYGNAGSKPKPSRRIGAIAASAAAVVVAVGLGTALIAGSIASKEDVNYETASLSADLSDDNPSDDAFGYTNDYVSSPESSEQYDMETSELVDTNTEKNSCVEKDSSEFTYNETEAPTQATMRASDYTDSTDAFCAAVTASDIVGSDSDGASGSTITEAESISIVGEVTQYVIKSPEITLSLPNEVFFTGEEVPDSFPPLEQFRLTAEQLESNLKKRGIVGCAVWNDGGSAVNELVVVRTVSDDTANIFNLGDVGEYELGLLKERYLSYGDTGNNLWTQVDSIECGEHKYIRAFGTAVDGSENQMQYMTIINGEQLAFTLIEHYDERCPMTEPMVAEGNRQLMEQVMQSVKYGRIKSRLVNDFKRLSVPVKLSMLGLLFLAGLGIYSLLKKFKDKKKPVVAVPEDVPVNNDSTTTDTISSCNESVDNTPDEYETAAEEELPSEGAESGVTADGQATEHPAGEPKTEKADE